MVAAVPAWSVGIVSMVFSGTVVLVVGVVVAGWVVACVWGGVVVAVVGMVVGSVVALVGALLLELVLHPERSVAINAIARTV